jgi:hypothetical protein
MTKKMPWWHAVCRVFVVWTCCVVSWIYTCEFFYKMSCDKYIIQSCIENQCSPTGRYYHFVLEWILIPAVHLLLRILGIALGIGLGPGLATHVHDTLETWHE